MSDTQAASVTIRHARSEGVDVIVAALTAVATNVSFILAILTPPNGGPFCTAGRTAPAQEGLGLDQVRFDRCYNAIEWFHD